jgi:hypothetical protein
MIPHPPLWRPSRRGDGLRRLRATLGRFVRHMLEDIAYLTGQWR